MLDLEPRHMDIYTTKDNRFADVGRYIQNRGVVPLRADRVLNDYTEADIARVRGWKYSEARVFVIPREFIDD